MSTGVTVPSRHGRCQLRMQLLLALPRRERQDGEEGGVLFASAILATAFIHFALTAAGDKGVSGDAIRVLNILDADAWVLFNPALGVLMLGAAGVLLTHATAARWMGWAALILGIALFIPFADFFALLLSGVWIAVESVMLYRKPAAATAPLLPAQTEQPTAQGRERRRHEEVAG